MSAEAWRLIEELFLRGLHAHETVRRQLLEEVSDPEIAAAVAQLWADAAAAPSAFLGGPQAAEAPVPYAVGDVVDGRFRLERLLGTGGMSQVFGAIDTRLDRPVALKFLNPALATHPVTRGLLEREARAVCRLADHPSICTVHDLFWDRETPVLVMELLAGETLAARLARGPLPIADALAVGLAIVDGLAYAHGRDVIHRDIKPGNVMLTPFGPKLFDFGIAKRIEPSLMGDASILAPPGVFVGSVSYTSPEQAEGLPIDARSDIFSVGCVLYEMVTGRKAFDGSSRLAILSAVLRVEPEPIRTSAPSVPLEYTRIVARCLEKNPARRFQRTTELRDALDRVARSSLDHAGGIAARAPGATATPDDGRAERGGQERSASSPLPRDTARDGGLLGRGIVHPICLMLSVAYGAMVGLALLVEIAYEWPAFGAWALPVAAVTGIASTAVSLAALALLRYRTARLRTRAILVTVTVFAAWSLVIAAAVAPRLPDRPLVRARIQTMTANVGYPKSLLEALALPVLAIVPLHVVLALEMELRLGSADRVYRILTSGDQTPSVPGTLVVRPTTASVVFATVSIWWMDLNRRLMENLEDGPYYGLFLELGIVRVASGLLMLFAVLGWYLWTWNDLRTQSQLSGQPTTASDS